MKPTLAGKIRRGGAMAGEGRFYFVTPARMNNQLQPVSRKINAPMLPKNEAIINGETNSAIFNKFQLHCFNMTFRLQFGLI